MLFIATLRDVESRALLPVIDYLMTFDAGGQPTDDDWVIFIHLGRRFLKTQVRTYKIRNRVFELIFGIRESVLRISSVVEILLSKPFLLRRLKSNADNFSRFQRN